MARRKLMTLSEAWLYIANDWRGAAAYHTIYGVYTSPWYSREGHDGLCSCVSDLYGRKMITVANHHEMQHIIDAVPKRKNTLFKWTRTKRGAEARVRFCLKQAAKARRAEALRRKAEAAKTHAKKRVQRV